MFKQSKNKQIEGDYALSLNIINSVVPDLNIADIHPTTTFESLGFDSIKFINLVLKMEEATGVKLEEIVEKIDFSEFLVVKDLADLLGSIKL